MAKSVAGGLITLVLVVGNVVISPAFAQGKAVTACVAAVNKTDYGDVLTIPAELRAQVDDYRADWNTFCGQKPGGAITLAALYAKAGRISAAFDRLIDQAGKDVGAIKDGEANRKRADAIDDALRTRYPAFVPAFEGSFWESSFFNPLTDAFKAHAAQGSHEDRLFFDSGMSLTIHIWEMPWLERTWDYGGCLRFGDFDWVAEARKIARLKNELKEEVYLRQVADYESAFFSPIEDVGTNVCACDRKDAVLQDYEKLSQALAQQPSLASHLPKLRLAMAAIQSSRITIGSEKEKHCSGG